MTLFDAIISGLFIALLIVSISGYREMRDQVDYYKKKSDMDFATTLKAMDKIKRLQKKLNKEQLPKRNVQNKVK